MGHPEEIGEQVDPYFSPPSNYNLPEVKGERALGELALLDSLTALPTKTEVALLRAARMYQDALWLAESAPELTWLLLVSTVEAAANDWNRQRGDSSLRLMASKPELYEFLTSHSDPSLLKRIADEFTDSLGMTKKFVDFCLAFVRNPPQRRPPEFAQFPWTEENLRESLRLIYRYRSNALHSGKPFPAPMCSPQGLRWSGGVASEKSLGGAAYQRGSTWLAHELPMSLHLFEYIARTAVLGWWRSLVDQGASEVTAV